MHDIIAPAVMQMAVLTDDTDHDWRSRALCADTDPEQMQPDRPVPADVRRLRTRCSSCPVLSDCRKLAETHQPYGIWAGEWYGEWTPAMPHELIGADAMRAHVIEQAMTDKAIAELYGLERRSVQRYRVELELERPAHRLSMRERQQLRHAAG